MTSQHSIQNVRRLTYKVVKSMVERTNDNLQHAVPFLDVYSEACNRFTDINDQFDKNNEEMREAIRNNLFQNRFVTIDSKNAEVIRLTRHGLDIYQSLPEEKW